MKNMTFNSVIHTLITLLITKPKYKKELKYIEEMAVKSGFNLKLIHKLIIKHESKQNNITAVSKIKTNKPNKWITLIYIGNKSTRLTRIIRKID